MSLKDLPARFENWFVAHLKPGGRNRAQDNLRRQGFDTFCPERATAGRRTGGRAPDRRPLFPGYLFVRFDPGLGGWQAINSTRGVLRLLLADPRRPQPLPGGLMRGLIHRCDKTGLLVRPDESLAAGDHIRILSGPFADYVTRIEHLSDSERISVLIELLSRPVHMTLSRDNVEKIA